MNDSHKSSIPRWGIEHLLFEMEEDGVLAWTGEYRNGQKVYRATEAGLYAFENQEARASRGVRDESHSDQRRLRRAAVEKYLSKLES